MAGPHRPWIYFRGKCATQHLSNSKRLNGSPGYQLLSNFLQNSTSHWKINNPDFIPIPASLVSSFRWPESVSSRERCNSSDVTTAGNKNKLKQLNPYTWVGPNKHVFDGSTHCHYLANMTEPPVCVGDAALCSCHFSTKDLFRNGWKKKPRWNWLIRVHLENGH